MLVGSSVGSCVGILVDTQIKIIYCMYAIFDNSEIKKKKAISQFDMCNCFTVFVE